MKKKFIYIYIYIERERERERERGRKSWNILILRIIWFENSKKESNFFLPSLVLLWDHLLQGHSQKILFGGPIYDTDLLSYTNFHKHASLDYSNICLRTSLD